MTPTSRTQSSAARLSVLRRTQLLLGFLILALTFVGPRDTYWPIVPWPVYARFHREFPPPTTSLLELRVTTGKGEVRVLRPQDLVEWSRHPIADRAMRGSLLTSDPVRRDLDREYLTHLVTLALPGEPADTIDLWRIEWQVDPLRIPPLHRSRPSSETQLWQISPQAKGSLP